MARRADRVRIPIAAIAVVGLGALVALAVGISLYLGLSSATENTRRLMAQRSEALVDSLEQRIASQLQPVVRQAQWAVEQFESGTVRLDDAQALNTFILGALGAMPQVEGVAITDPGALSRRWRRSSAEPLVEDWSDRPDVITWIEAGASQIGSKWQAPFWTHTLGTTILLLDTPIRFDGKFAGLLSQAVTISDLSLYITSVATETTVTPFILYGHDHVLAHPLLISWTPAVTNRDQPLLALDALGDAVLERIWTPDQQELFLLGGMTAASASGATVGKNYYVFLYRDIDRFGPEPWTIGAYVDTGTSDVGEWLADIVDAALSGSFAYTGTTEGNEFERVVASVIAGFAVLVLSVAVAAWLGARASRPIRALAAAARSIEAQRLDRIRSLPSSRVAEFDDANRSFNQMVAGLKEREVIRETLGRFVPTDVARALLSEGGELAPQQSEATVLFCDLEGFTSLTETLGPAGIVELLNEYFEAMVEILERHRGVVTQFQGDAILATFNVPVPDAGHAANALRAATEMQSAVRRRAFAGNRIGNRIGINTGRLVAGAVGAKGRLSYTVHGDAVNLAARLEALNKELGTSILVSEATAARVEGFNLQPMGKVDVRGQTGRVAVYALGDAGG
ncbi:MAG: adenylate/guanylate cyclase domain-containing protein [Gammaproteobacteria bacterium]|nr:adenylate/guanylate cyclase domain-containing protein [Gammaproteobacteria bacterium]